MRIEIQCLCGRVLSADASQAGREVICPACHRLHIVPEMMDVAGDRRRPSSRRPERVLVTGAVTSVLVIGLALMWALLEHPGTGGGGGSGNRPNPYAGRFDRGMGTGEGPCRDLGGGGATKSDPAEASEGSVASPTASKEKKEQAESREPPGVPHPLTAPTPLAQESVPAELVERIPEPKIVFSEAPAPAKAPESHEENKAIPFGRAEKWIGSKTARKSYGRRGNSNFARKKGATAESEAAVERGLAWLAKVQYEDGHWTVNGEAGRTRRTRRTGRTGRRGFEIYNIADMGYTSLGTLAFLGAGYTHKHDCKYKQTIAKSVHWLVENTHGENFPFSNVYSLGLAGMALSEAYGMTSDKTLRKPAQNVIDRLISLMGSDGGYSYHGPGNDNHQTSFAVMAVKSAMMAELNVPPGAKRRLLGYYDACLAENGTMGYHGSSGSSPDSVCTAVGLFVRMFLGVHPKQEKCRKIAGVLDKAGPQLDSPLQVYDGTYGMFQMGGTYWSGWNRRFRDAVIQRQTPVDKNTGYWKNSGRCTGDVDTTCFYLMSLEVYYRFLPVNE